MSGVMLIINFKQVQKLNKIYRNLSSLVQALHHASLCYIPYLLAYMAACVRIALVFQDGLSYMRVIKSHLKYHGSVISKVVCVFFRKKK